MVDNRRDKAAPDEEKETTGEESGDNVVAYSADDDAGRGGMS